MVTFFVFLALASGIGLSLFYNKGKQREDVRMLRKEETEQRRWEKEEELDQIEEEEREFLGNEDD